MAPIPSIISNITDEMLSLEYIMSNKIAFISKSIVRDESVLFNEIRFNLSLKSQNYYGYVQFIDNIIFSFCGRNDIETYPSFTRERLDDYNNDITKTYYYRHNYEIVLFVEWYEAYNLSKMKKQNPQSDLSLCLKSLAVETEKIKF